MTARENTCPTSRLCPQPPRPPQGQRPTGMTRVRVAAGSEPAGLRRGPADAAAEAAPERGRGHTAASRQAQDEHRARTASAWEGAGAPGRSAGVRARGRLPGPAAGPPCPPRGAAGRVGATWSISEWAETLAPRPVQDEPEEAPLPTHGGAPETCPARGQTEWTGQRWAASTLLSAHPWRNPTQGRVRPLGPRGGGPIARKP